MIHNHEVPSSILGPATRNVLRGVSLIMNHEVPSSYLATLERLWEAIYNPGARYERTTFNGWFFFSMVLRRKGSIHFQWFISSPFFQRSEG